MIRQALGIVLSTGVALGAFASCTTTSGTTPTDGGTADATPDVTGIDDADATADVTGIADADATADVTGIPDADATADVTGIPDVTETPDGDGGLPQVQLDQANVVRVAAATIPQESLLAAVTANNAFAVDLFSRLDADGGATNLLTSPISASLALTMAYAGAVGQTGTEMATALHFDSDGGTSIFDGQNALTQDLASRGPTALSVAQHNAQGSAQPPPSEGDYDLRIINEVWGEQTYSWAAPFLATMAASYGTGVYLQDFIGHPDQARQTINAWVSAETSGKIVDFLLPPSIDMGTRMVLVDALHLKLPWANAFEPLETTTGTFTRADGTDVAPSFMKQTQTVPYSDDGSAQIVAWPLFNGQISVVIALPDSGNTLAAYEASLGANSPAFRPPQSTALVNLSLPKVTFTSPTFSLKTALMAMGMKLAFRNGAADFTGLCPAPQGSDLFVKDVLQKAAVSMQESGLEAAAATAVIIGVDGAAGEAAAPVTMVVDRPYLVTIVDVPTGAILLLGHVVDPTDSGGP
ncbi:MAG: serpin family protein [Polyangiaceae bacterium]